MANLSPLAATLRFQIPSDLIADFLFRRCCMDTEHDPEIRYFADTGNLPWDDAPEGEWTELHPFWWNGGKPTNF